MINPTFQASLQGRQICCLAFSKEDKTKYKRFGLGIIRKAIAYLQPYFFYTKRFLLLKNSTIKSYNEKIIFLFFNTAIL